jgi:hypothetical protein
MSGAPLVQIRTEMTIKNGDLARDWKCIAGNAGKGWWKPCSAEIRVVKGMSVNPFQSGI